MARTTPLRGWSYPDFEQNPYDATFVDLVEAQDADVQTLFTGKPWTGVIAAYSSVISNPFVAHPGTAFNKTIVLPANTLGVVGATISIVAAGIYTSGTTTPINLTLVGKLQPADLTIAYGLVQIPTSRTDFGWNFSGVSVIRTVGASGTAVGGYGTMGLYPDPLTSAWGDGGTTSPIDTTAVQTCTLYAYLTPSGMTGFTITLGSATLTVSYPNAVTT